MVDEASRQREPVVVRDVEFAAADGTILRGWHVHGERGDRPWPIVVVSHGFGAVKEMYLDDVAHGLVAAGLSCLVYDHRGFGGSGGFPRQEIDPFLQVSDSRDAITFAQGLPGVDPDRCGVWGSSYSGGHALVVAATDRRVRCVVAQIPTISGARNTLRRFPGDGLTELRRRFAADREGRMRGEPPVMVPISADLTPSDVARGIEEPDWPMVGNDQHAWCSAIPGHRLEPWRNEITLRSLELYASYEPGVHITQIAPTPLLVICMAQDTITPTDEILAAYSIAREPKRLFLRDGGHFDAYGIHRDATLDVAAEWFVEHLSARRPGE